MIEELLPWYERELTFLKHEAVLFARKYPELASRLSLQETDTENIDPHAERLLEGAALLAARVRRKLDDDYPELSDALLDLLFPHFLAPVPSLSIVQFGLDPDQGQVTTRLPIAAGTELESRPVDGQTCRYRTCYAVDVWPVALDEAELESPARAMPRRASGSPTVLSALRLTFTSPTGEPLAGMGMETLRLHFTGEPALEHGLLELFLEHAVHAEVTGTTEEGEERCFALPPEAMRPVGFGDDEGLIPYPARSFLGFRLIQEYFTLREKYMFVDVTGLGPLATSGIAESMTLHVYFDEAPSFQQAIAASNIRLGCTPIVNLFERWGEPINLSHRRSEYPVIPDARDPNVEAWRVVDVSARSADDARTVGIRPLFSLGAAGKREGSQLTWQAVRRFPAEDVPSQLWLGVGLPEVSAHAPAPEVLSVRLLCTNGNLPTELRTGTDPRRGDFQMEGGVGALRIAALRQPTSPIRPRTGSGAHWKLVSHLALNQVSLVSDGGAALRGLLELYEPTNTRAARQQVAAVRDLTSRVTSHFVGGSVVKGMSLRLDLDRTAFTGTSEYLFCAVLDRFLAAYVALNSFSQLTVRPLDNPEEGLAFPPRAGHQVLA